MNTIKVDESDKTIIIKTKKSIKSFVDRYLKKDGDCYEYYNPDFGMIFDGRTTKFYRYKNGFIYHNHKQVDSFFNLAEFKEHVWKNRKYINLFNKNKERRGNLNEQKAK